MLQVEASSLWTRFFAAYRFVNNNADKSLNEIAANINNYYDADFLARTFAEVDGWSEFKTIMEPYEYFFENYMLLGV